MKNIPWRLVIIFGVVISAVVYLLPTVKPGMWPHKKINLGLDLQGGMHLVLEVETKKAVESTVERITHEMRSLLKKERILYSSLERVEGSIISIQFKDGTNLDKFNAMLDKEFRELRNLSESSGADGSIVIRMDLPEKETDRIEKSATDRP